MLIKESLRYNLLKQLPMESLSEKDFNLIYETEVGTIQSFHVENKGANFYDNSELLEYYQLLYELEYKYNMGSKAQFNGNPKRRENILNIFGQKASQLVDAIAPTLAAVYEDWVQSHDTENPDEMFEKRFETGNPEYTMNSLITSYAQETDGSYDERKVWKYYNEMARQIDSNIDDYPTIKSLLDDDDEYSEMKRSDMRDYLESYGLEDFNSQYSTEFEEEAAAEDYIDNYEASYEFSEMFPEPSSLTGVWDFEAVAKEIYRNLIMPNWENKWSNVGSNVDDNREILYLINNIENQPLGEKMVILSRALNGVHQTGDMMDHYENTYSISKSQLDDLSNSDVDEWNKELNMLGFSMN